MPRAHQVQQVDAVTDRRVVFLLDASSRVERRLLLDWITEHHAPSGIRWDAIPIPPSRRRRRRRTPRLDPRLEACLAADDDPLLTPLRVAWFTPKKKRGAVRSLGRLVLLGDPRDPGRARQWLASRTPDRFQVVAGDAATVTELRDRWVHNGGPGSSETTGLAEFVARQAALALERAERRLRGLRYKVPRFVGEDILSRPAFRGGIARLAHEVGKPEADVLREAQGYLKEIRATHSPYVIDLTAKLIHQLYTQGYGESLHYDRAQLARIYALAQRHPVVFLPSHKSNLDHLVLQYALHENGHPPNHTAGGINMNFFPVGPLIRRSGVFFIRRTFKDNPVYKFVLRHYIDYLIEKRFSLEWYIEGGRSRSGKLLPPRFGLLANVVDAYRRGKSEDVHLIPVAIAYDQIQDVGAYTAEQRGGAKQRENFGWFVNVVRGLRRRFGDIHIRFGEPVSLAAMLGPPDPHAEPQTESEEDEQTIAVQKLAFEVSVRINNVTPMTPTSLVALALLGRGDRALSVPETVVALGNLVTYIRRRKLPTTMEIDLDTEAGVQRALDTLVESGIVNRYAEGPEPVYAIAPDQHLTAAYYRNTIIHFFVNAAIAELALLRAGEDHVEDRRGTFWDEAMRLRDLLKFEFFFAEKDRFRVELADEIALHDPKWESALARGPAAIQSLVRSFRPFNAHRILRPFLQGYQVVGDTLERENPAVAIDQAKLLDRCLGVGKQYLLQRRISNAESVSKVLFEAALRLAKNRGLLEPGAPDLAERRKAFADEIRSAVRRADAVEALVAARVTRLIS
ncbi:MAG TPA: glycerol-3-phosphate 1-O-acyltransferase [Candidatus Binatia bacterium]|jgi:glycerol-3-phosphate O-acyltransferase|nr:glycerol-3-phosphate 1-O-acyltransferase [Candidatus Binatia bacterium]